MTQDLTPELTEEQLEDLLLRAFLLALRVRSETYQIATDIREDPAWPLLEQIAAGELTLTKTPAESAYLHEFESKRPAASQEAFEVYLEEVHTIMREERTNAQKILAARQRLLTDPPQPDAGAPGG